MTDTIYAICGQCGAEIERDRSGGWQHVGALQPKHFAIPKDDWDRILAQAKDNQQPITSSYFFELLGRALDMNTRNWYRVTIVAEHDQPLAITIDRWGGQAVVDALAAIPEDVLKRSVTDDE